LIPVIDRGALSPEERLAFWQESERFLTDLLEVSSSYLTDTQRRTVLELIDHNEHQLALEFLFDYLDESVCEYPAALVSRFSVLVDRLGMTGNRSVSRLGDA
jgi:hypothetical protein